MSLRNDILAKARAIPGMPSAATQIIRLLRNPDASIASLARTAEYAPGLTSNILRLANSAYFGVPRSTKSVQEAFVRLGINRVLQVVVASAVAPVAQQSVRGYDLPAGALWQHLVAVAVGTAELASALRLKLPDHAFTAGLLHDIGKVVLGTFLEVEVTPIKEMAFDEGVSFEAAEERVLGVNHAEVGAAVLEGWNFPQAIVDVVRWHHEPDSCPGDSLTVDLVHVSDAIALMSGIGAAQDGLNYKHSKAALARLHISPGVAETVACRMIDGLRELHGLFPIAPER